MDVFSFLIFWFVRSILAFVYLIANTFFIFFIELLVWKKLYNLAVSKKWVGLVLDKAIIRYQIVIHVLSFVFANIVSVFTLMSIEVVSPYGYKNFMLRFALSSILSLIYSSYCVGYLTQSNKEKFGNKVMNTILIYILPEKINSKYAEIYSGLRSFLDYNAFVKIIATLVSIIVFSISKLFYIFL